MNTNDKAIVILLSMPALTFVRDVRRRLDSDAAYLNAHEEELRNKVVSVLTNSGLLWDEPIMRREAIPMLKEAIVQLRLIEK